MGGAIAAGGHPIDHVVAHGPAGLREPRKNGQLQQRNAESQHRAGHPVRLAPLVQAARHGQRDGEQQRCLGDDVRRGQELQPADKRGEDREPEPNKDQEDLPAVRLWCAWDPPRNLKLRLHQPMQSTQAGMLSWVFVFCFFWGGDLEPSAGQPTRGGW